MDQLEPMCNIDLCSTASVQAARWSSMVARPAEGGAASLSPLLQCGRIVNTPIFSFEKTNQHPPLTVRVHAKLGGA